VTAAVLLASVLLHLGMLGMIVLAERRGPTTAESEAIEVELVKAPEPPEQPKPDPIKPEPKKPEPPKPEPQKIDLPKPEPKPEAQKQAEQTAKPEPPKPAEQKPPPAPAAPPPQAQEPPAQSASAAPPDQPPMPPEKPAAPAGPSGGPGEGRTKLTPEEIAALRAQIQKCWTLPVGLPDAMKLEAILRVRLQRNGALSGSPELLKANASAGGPVLVGIAMKALQECGPYRTLPAAKYAEWRVLDLRFLATGMTGLGSARPPATQRPAG
jgi:hypothetical protein